MTSTLFVLAPRFPVIAGSGSSRSIAMSLWWMVQLVASSADNWQKYEGQAFDTRVKKTAAATAFDMAVTVAATAVGTAAGGAIGGAVGGPIGAAIGARVGGLAGSAAAAIALETKPMKDLREGFVSWFD